MKKRILSLALALTLVLAFVPFLAVPALAADTFDIEVKLQEDGEYACTILVKAVLLIEYGSYRCIDIILDWDESSVKVIDGEIKTLSSSDPFTASEEVDGINGIWWNYNILGGEYDGSEVRFILTDDGFLYVTEAMSGKTNGDFAGDKWSVIDPSVFAATAVPLPAPAPTPAATVTTSPTANKVLVDGKEVAFDAYNINDENYFKLRDVAFVLNGTRVQFNAALVDGAINIYKNTAYEPNGSEMQSKGEGSKEATLNKMKILIDGVETELTAYLIDGNNYFKMRELAQTFDFFPALVDGVITIDTTKPYGG
ncbi:MAG: hypothetical protein FWG36_08270 [Oscillospiraceae bacterium]|nr:hypothetical protein [Oscillospiraceae bacterium]